MFYVFWDNFSSHHPEHVLKTSNIFKGNTVSEFEFRCSETIVFAVYISFTNLLNGVGGVGSVGAWIRGLRESNFGIDPVCHVGPQNVAWTNKWQESKF